MYRLLSKLSQTTTTSLLIATLAACASYTTKPTSAGMTSSTAMPPFNQSVLPAAVQVPAGHRMVLETVAKGEITYTCSAKTGAAGQFEWVFTGPKAAMTLRNKQKIGTYFGPPATWLHNDGSVVTGMQVAVAPNNPSSIPLQLVKASPKAQAGVFAETTYIQRVNTEGGIAPKLPCGMGNVSEKQTVEYSSDYIFWKAN
jgi:Protein of unknown function (DUF3455)